MRKSMNNNLWFMAFIISAFLALFMTGCGGSGAGGNGGGTSDNTAPTVNSTNPAKGAAAVAINSAIAATFSEAMTPSTVNTTTFTLKQGTTAVSGAVTFTGLTAVFIPASSLAVGTEYTATITAGAKDLAGNTLAGDYVCKFTTGATADITAPTITGTTDVDGATNVAVNSQIGATFGEGMDPLTISNANFTLKNTSSGAAVTGTVSYSGVNAVFTPAGNLYAGTGYTATIKGGANGVKDLAGNALAADSVWSFTTAAAAAAKGPAPVLLGSAGNYVILAETGVSTVPASAITGDIGLSPAAASYLTGFSLTMVGTTAAISPQVTGSLYAADMTAPTSTNLTTAITDMGTAYTDAAGRPTPDFLDLGVGEVGGKTLLPGLYKWTTGVTVSSDVTISGGANDVWIFQIPGNFAINPAKNIFLSGGAQARNIFWQVAGTVTIGTTAHFEGIILSQTSIMLETAASMNGRALAQSAVILDAGTVTKPN